MKTSFSLILAAAVAALLSSCYVVPDKPAGRPTRAQLEQQKKEAEELAKKEAEEKKKQELEAQKKKEREAVAKGEAEADKKSEAVTKPQTDDLPTPRQVAPDTKPSYPVAKKAPGKEGFVLSPYNQKLVDVRGIASGKLVRDPTYDPSEKKFFRVP
jgi:membrane-bound lytic murein transglycosylase